MKSTVPKKLRNSLSVRKRCYNSSNDRMDFVRSETSFFNAYIYIYVSVWQIYNNHNQTNKITR